MRKEVAATTHSSPLCPPAGSIPPPTGPDTCPVPRPSDGLMPDQTVKVVFVHPLFLKSLPIAYLLWFNMGLHGLHHFYLRRNAMGVLYLLTLGDLGIGWLVDLIRMPWLVEEANRRIRHPEEDVDTVSVCDAYIMWFPFGILGAHHYYLRNWAWGVAYTFTIGLFGIGWLVDLFRIPSMVRTTNERLEMDRLNATPPDRVQATTAVVRRELFYQQAPPVGTVPPINPSIPSDQQQQYPPIYETSIATTGGLAIGGSTYAPAYGTF